MERQRPEGGACMASTPQCLLMPGVVTLLLHNHSVELRIKCTKIWARIYFTCNLFIWAAGRQKDRVLSYEFILLVAQMGRNWQSTQVPQVGGSLAPSLLCPRVHASGKLQPGARVWCHTQGLWYGTRADHLKQQMIQSALLLSHRLNAILKRHSRLKIFEDSTLNVIPGPTLLVEIWFKFASYSVSKSACWVSFVCLLHRYATFVTSFFHNAYKTHFTGI